MIALISFLVIIFVSLTIVRIATVMLRLTGLSEDIARFQARSAFTTTGFTAQESEVIMNNPTRRKIIGNLMVLGNVGFVTFISSLLLTFLTGEGGADLLWRLGFIVGGSLLIFLVSSLKMFDNVISWFVRKAVGKDTRLYVKDYDSLLFLARDFEIVKVQVKGGTWLADKPLKVTRLSEEGALIIGVRRTDGYFLGSPRGDSVLYPGDEVILYGREELLKEICDRPAGEAGDTVHRNNAERQRMREGRAPAPESGAAAMVRKAARTFRNLGRDQGG